MVPSASSASPFPHEQGHSVHCALVQRRGRGGVFTHFNTIAKLFSELKIDATRIFNMDETLFLPKTTRRKVVAVCGSVNVWRKETKTNFHMIVVVAVSAAGIAVPPILIVPGVRLFKENVAALTIKDAAITGAPEGFGSTKIFMEWLRFFGEHVTNLKKPVVLIVDTSTTHIGPDEQLY